jgi:hypothetical protein
MNRDIRHAQVGDDVIPSSQWTAKVVAVPETPDYSDTVTVQLGETSLLAQIPASMLKLRAAEGQRVNGEGQYQALRDEIARGLHDRYCTGGRGLPPNEGDRAEADAVMPIVARELAARDAEIGRLRSEVVQLQHELADATIRGWR